MNALDWSLALYEPIQKQAEIDDPIDVVPVMQALASIVASIAKVSDEQERLLVIFSESLEVCLNSKKVTVQ